MVNQIIVINWFSLGITILFFSLYYLYQYSNKKLEKPIIKTLSIIDLVAKQIGDLLIFLILIGLIPSIILTIIILFIK